MPVTLCDVAGCVFTRMVKFTDCKINIGLNIVAKRVDGYHDIETVMVPVPWHDVVEIIPSRANESTLMVLGNKVDCPPEKNLVMKAFRLLQSQFSLPECDIILQKIVPDGAGLGGGSGDAAATLLLLNELFDLKLTKEALAAFAARLGADCPFFVYDRPMLCTGTGTTLCPIDLDLHGYTLLIVKPATVSISTREAYDGIVPRKSDFLLEEILKLPVNQWQGKVKNDFENTIFALAPEVKQLKQQMIENGAEYASMSGSGSSVYGLFADNDAALALKKRLEDKFSTFICRM